MGLKLHEDWGTTPAAIDNCLTVAEEYDIQVSISSPESYKKKFSVLSFTLVIILFYT